MKLKISKIKIKKKYKYSIVATLSVVMAMLLFFLISDLIYPKEIKVEKDLYNYNIKPSTNYEVKLKPNALYDVNIMGENKIYFSEIIDTINANFSYLYNGNEKCIIAGSYNITALMEGYITNSDETNITIWQKPFNIISSTNFKLNNNKHIISKDININFNDYNTLAKKIIDNIKTPSQVRLVVTMNVDINANTNNGVIKESSKPSITIPLNTSMLEISKIGIEEKEDKITETIIEKVPVNNFAILIYTIFAIITLIGVIYTLIFIQVEKVVKTEKEIKKIFKNHGTRLVALLNEINYKKIEDIYSVKNIEDLVKISDELEKPIFYEQKKNIKEIKKYYVINDKTIYEFDILDTDIDEEIELESSDVS